MSLAVRVRAGEQLSVGKMCPTTQTKRMISHKRVSCLRCIEPKAECLLVTMDDNFHEEVPMQVDERRHHQTPPRSSLVHHQLPGLKLLRLKMNAVLNRINMIEKRMKRKRLLIKDY